MHLAEVRQLDDVVLLRYLLGGDGPAARNENGTRRGAGRDVAASGSPGGPVEPGTGAQPTAVDQAWLAQAIELSRRCPASTSAFSVGAVVVAADGAVMATGYSRETGPRAHAEEVALARTDPADPRLAGATLYSSLEPCRVRASGPTPCAELIVAAGLRRVVIAWLEPPVFAPGGGAARLRAAGITVVEVPGLAAEARAVNAAVLSEHGPGAFRGREGHG
jgi:pyrimidine deaminase RibD-like protein